MSEANDVDVAVVGGGIVGLATAWALVCARKSPRVVVLESESRVASHQSGHNSGVVHSGLYYAPGSAKARLCRDGRRKLIEFCEKRDVPLRITGKLVVATRENERSLLAKLAERGRANGLQGLTSLSSEQIREHEPHAAGVAALLVPEAGVVDYAKVAAALARGIEESGGAVRTSARVLRIVRDGERLVLETEAGAIRSRALVACAGLQADRVARLAGLEPEVAIVPFRGDYFSLVPERAELVKTLIYPVPDPRFPFLGIHFTRRIDDLVEVGPSAVLALDRGGYGRYGASPRDAFDAAMFPGLWRFVARHLSTAAGEVVRTVSPAGFASAARRLVPDLRRSDLVRAGCGIRAQAMRSDGSLVEDFHFVEDARMVHVLNAPSPAATASLAIGEEIATRAIRRLGQ
jgi:L-2-hydroxyglutarate oxidase